MKKILCTAIAIAFMSAPVYAEPVKMTTAQLDEVTAAGSKKIKIHVKDVAAAVIVSSGDYNNNLAIALQDVSKSKITIYATQKQ